MDRDSLLFNELIVRLIYVSSRMKLDHSLRFTNKYMWIYTKSKTHKLKKVK